MKKPITLLTLILLTLTASASVTMPIRGTVVPASDSHIQYIGRIDFSNPDSPLFTYPGIQINLMEGIRDAIFQNLEENKADMGFMAYSEPMPYEWIPLTEEEIVAAVPEDHPLAGADCFPIKECENTDFILGSWGKEREILAILHKHGVRPHIKYTTYDTPATLAMVSMGLGISLVNELSAQYWNEHLVKLPLEEREWITFGIVVPSKDSMTSAAHKFFDYALKYLKEDNKEE